MTETKPAAVEGPDFDRMAVDREVLREARRDREMIKALAEALEAVQWHGRDGFRCTDCGGQPSTGHTAACRVAAALRLARGEG